MARTRQSLPLVGAAGKPLGQATAGTTAANPAARRQSLRNRASVAASETASSAASPAGYSSASEYSTPLTSNVATPAPSIPGTSSKPTRTRSSRTKAEVEISIPSKKPALAKDSVKALSKSKFSLTSSKRKRDEIADSEDDYDSDASPDAKLARRLQHEEDQKAAGDLLISEAARPGPSNYLTRALRGRSSNAPPAPIAGPSTRRALNARHGLVVQDAAPTASRTARQTTKRPVKPIGKASNPIVVVNSDDDVSYAEDDNDSDEWSEVVAVGSGHKKQKLSSTSRAAKTAKGKGKGKARVTIAVDASDDDGDDWEYVDPDVDDEGENDNDDGASQDGGDDTVRTGAIRRQYRRYRSKKRTLNDRGRLEKQHPILTTMWKDLQKMPVLKAGKAEQPRSISRILKPFQLEGLAWMMAMEKTAWKGGLLGDEMGLGKTIQAVSLIMSDYPAKKPTLVLAPPVALMQWTSEIESYTDGRLNTLVFHGTNSKTKNMTVKELKKFDVIIMSYNSLESMYRKQEKGFKRKDGVYQEQSIVHATRFHRVILDEAHSIKTRTTTTAKACFALQVDYRWCLTGTPLQNRIGEFFSLIRFLEVRPFASYFCRDCACSKLEWSMNDDNVCPDCDHGGMRHVSVFNQELLNPIQRYGNKGPGAEAFQKLRLMTDRIMLRRLKKDHTDSMELPVKEINVDRQFFGEEENDFANSIMTSGQRKFDTYVAQGVLLNNYANIFGLIMQMRQVADHPDLILKKNSEGGQNVLVCCICDEPAEDAIRSRCKHDFCRECAKGYLAASSADDAISSDPDCPRCHIPLSIDLEQVEIEQDEMLVKKSSIINRIKMENWTSSSKIELLVHDLHRLRKDNASQKSIIFSQFTTMLQLIEWRLRRAGITTVMLDGSMTPAQRAASIDHFMKIPDVECFLVSLKAGGVALNLTEASRVFIVDPWWNPAAEWQSADRCHRIGQTRPCTITRLCIEDSVESRMVMLQEKKTKMINSTINSDDAAMESLTPEDLQFLFRGT